MKTLLLAVLGLALAIPAFAQNSQPSSKATAKASALTLLPKTSTSSGWHTVLSQQIKTAQGKDLFIVPSFEVGLFTQTRVSSKTMVDDTSVGQAQVDVRVLVDGREAEPGVVAFGKRTQVLTAQLEGQIGNALVSVTNVDGTISTTVDLTLVQPETIELILDSVTASSFNFVAEDLQSGIHTISVQARIDTIGSAQQGSFSALGLIGKGCVTIQSVRMVKAEDVVDVP